MQIIYNDSHDQYFNLAAEEYLLENSDDDIFMLWRNDRTVVVGKNQNTWAEVSTPFVRENSIGVVRRMTGGGAVFHDLGNVNFTFICAYGGGGIDFSRFASPIIRYLGTLGIDASLGGRNDILADGRKISGNALCVFRRSDGSERLMHHGTLLYCADLSEMSGALNVNREKLVTKGIESVKSRVANISALSEKLSGISPEEFLLDILRFAESEYGAPSRKLTGEERGGISSLRDSKYATWEWNYGASPSFGNERTERFPFGTLTVMYTADRGILSDIGFFGDFFGEKDTHELEERQAHELGEQYAHGEAARDADDGDVQRLEHHDARDVGLAHAEHAVKAQLLLPPLHEEAVRIQQEDAGEERQHELAYRHEHGDIDLAVRRAGGQLLRAGVRNDGGHDVERRRRADHVEAAVRPHAPRRETRVERELTHGAHRLVR